MKPSSQIGQLVNLLFKFFFQKKVLLFSHLSSTWPQSTSLTASVHEVFLTFSKAFTVACVRSTIIYLSTNFCRHFRPCSSSPAHQLSSLCSYLCQSPDLTPACRHGPDDPIIQRVHTVGLHSGPVICTLCSVPPCQSVAAPLFCLNLHACNCDFELY